MSSLHKFVFFYLQRIHHHVPPVSCTRLLRQLSSSMQEPYRLPPPKQRTSFKFHLNRTAIGFRTPLNYCYASSLQIGHLCHMNGHGRISVRYFSEQPQQQKNQEQESSSQQRTANRNTLMYVVAIAIAVTGLSYAAVPLYRIFCQATGYGGTVIKVDAGDKVEAMKPIEERELTIRFNADTSSAMRWHFKPQQQEIKIVPGETALAFYTACNPTDKPVTGIATYNVIPFEAGLYFNKIQCFCFEEQRLNPHEQVDMPVFFYIDPEFDEDPAMAKVDTITLSYTFFESKEGVELPQPMTPAPA